MAAMINPQVLLLERRSKYKILFYSKACLLNAQIKTNLYKQSSWASFTRRFRDMDIQAAGGSHCVQTEDVRGILWKQEKNDKSIHKSREVKHK